MRRPELLLIVFLLLLPGCATTKSGPSYSAKQLQEMGEKYLSSGDVSTALKYLTQAEEKKPDDPVIQYDLGLAYNMRGLSDKALMHFQKALKLNPKYTEALNAVGSVYAERGQIELAQEAFQKAMDDPFYNTPQLSAYNMGRLYEKKGDPERALTQYQLAVKMDPGYGAAWYRIGQILETMRRGDEARHSYGKAVAASPDLAEAHLRYGVMSYLAGDLEAALFSLSRVGRLAPNTGMADEARMYLERLRSVTQAKPGGAQTSAASPADIEVISNGQLQRQQALEKLPPPQTPPKTQLAIIPQETSPPPTPETLQDAPIKVKTAPVQIPAPQAPAAPARGTSVAPPPSESGAHKFIVQLGSFVDKEKAEEMQKHLKAKGYNTLVKPVKHQVLGRVYVIQLQPVSSESKAKTLMTQMGGEVEGEPVIIKFPEKAAEPKPPKDQTPAQ